MVRPLLLTLLTLPLVGRAADIRCVVTRENSKRELVFDQTLFSDIVRSPRALLIRRDGTVGEGFDAERDVPAWSKAAGAKKLRADLTGAVAVTLTPHDRNFSIAVAHVDFTRGVGLRTDAIVAGDATRMLHLFDGVNRLAIYCASEN